MKFYKRSLQLCLCLLLSFLFAACGTITTEDAAAYNKDLEEQQQTAEKATEGTCEIEVDCKTVLDQMHSLKETKKSIIPEDGIIYPRRQVPYYEGETVFDVLQRVLTEEKIHLEFSWSPLYESNYVEGIANLYEFDCGELSGWMYSVNDWFPNYGASSYIVSDGDVIEWRYTCDLGEDLGQTMGK